MAQDPIAVFADFDRLTTYLKNNPDLLELEDLGFTLLKSYQGREYIELFSEIKKIPSPNIEIDTQNLANNINYPDKKEYEEAILKCQKHIYEGDIYQANICHEFSVEFKENYELSQIKNFIYPRLRKLNPASHMALADFDDWLVFSSSPESLLKIEPGFKLTSSPIKGTALIDDDIEKLKTEKEKAEHIMIVDLIRNDLGRIAKTASVQVKNLLNDSKHTNLQHLVSDVEAQLKEDLSFEINGLRIPDFRKIFTAVFPGGSITGAPKIRSMQVIEDLEKTSRGLFTGSLGYYKFKEQKGEFNILIRSIFYNKKTGELSFNTGAGITSASDPQKEYEETLLKAEKLIEVFNAV